VRHVCAAAIVCVLAAVGCSSGICHVRTYPLEPKPKTSQIVVETIVTSEVERHAEDMVDEAHGGPLPSSAKVVPEEGTIVVCTTPAGHRRIERALREIRR